jgi:hypothetical protein
MFGGTRGAKPSDEPPQLNYKELGREVEALEKDINELRSLYELYFMGVEKMEPTNQRDLIKSQLRRWKELPIKNTAVRFHIQQLKARMVALENYWQRITKQKEDGTYSRDVARSKRRERERIEREARMKKLKDSRNGAAAGADSAPTQHAGSADLMGEGRAITGEELREGRSASETAGRNTPAQPASNSMSRPSASSADDLTEPKLRRLYQTYIGARKRCGEPVDLRYEDMAAALRKQVPRLLQSTGAKAVEFKVVIRSGRAVLKALPKH